MISEYVSEEKSRMFLNRCAAFGPCNLFIRQLSIFSIYQLSQLFCTQHSIKGWNRGAELRFFTKPNGC